MPLLIALIAFGSVPGWAQGQADEPSFAEKAEAIDQQFRDLSAKTEQLQARAEAGEGDYARIVRRRAQQAGLGAMARAHELAELVIAREAAGEDAAPWRERAVELLETIHTGARRIAATLGANPALRLGSAAEEPTPADLAMLETTRGKLLDRIISIYALLMKNLALSQELGIDTAEQRAQLESDLADFAENQSVALEDALDSLAETKAQLAVLPEDADLVAMQKVMDGRVRRIAGDLTRVVEMAGELDLDTARYRQQLIEVTGTVTTDIFDVDVLRGLVGRWFGGLGDWLVGNLPQFLFKLVLFALVLWLAFFLSRLTRRLVTGGLSRSQLNLSQLLKRMIISTAANLVLVLGLLFGLAQLGISVGPLLAGLGIAGFIVGFALQDTLGNFASGMMILLYRPYDVGDLIEAGGVFGKVSHMSLVNTTVLTVDNQTLVLPNSKIWGDVIKNVTAQRERRVDMVFGIGYGDDIPKAEKVLKEVLASHDKVLDQPESVVRLHTLGESSVDFIVRPWVKTDDYWDVYWDVTRAVKMRFDEEGISIPFPQRDVHIFSGDDDSIAAIMPARIEQGATPATAKSAPDAPDADAEEGGDSH